MKLALDNFKILFNDVYVLLVLAICIGLFIFKFPYLELPYFSDELWVYGPSLRKMGENYPSLIPTSLNIEEHWGHPLMYFFIGSIWCVIFGTSVLSTHIFAAIISSFLLLTIYYVVKNIFNKKIAFYSVLVFSFQSIFLGQHNLVLPEVMLTLFMFIVIYAYVKQKHILYIISGACLVLVKETGVLLICTIIIWHSLKNILYVKSYSVSKKTIKQYSIILLPLVFIASHVLMLKFFYGWYIMPKRIEHFTFSWEIYYDRIRDTFYYVFIDQGRKSITLVLFPALILFYTKIKLWQRLLLFAFVFSLVKVFFNYWKLPTLFPMIIVPIFIILLTKFLFWDVFKNDKSNGNFIAISTLFIYIYILFSASQFDSLRYLLCIIPLFIIIVLFIVYTNLSKFSKWVLPLIACLFACTSLIYLVNNKSFGDDTLNYDEVCKVNLKAVGYLEEQGYYNREINTSFLFSYQLTDYRTGYLSSKKEFENVKSFNKGPHKKGSFPIYVFSNIEDSEFYDKIKDSDLYNLEKRFTQGLHWVEIYSPKI